MSGGFGELPAVVALGGGHGLHASLSALRRVTDRLTAVVTVADDGGSSGRLRAELDCLPPGDLRQALAALCGDDSAGRLWADVLQSRFGGTGDLAGHAIGNLLIAGLWQRIADPVAGLDMVAGLLGAKGRVLPMSTTPLKIRADVIGDNPDHPDEATTLHGQARIATTPSQVMQVHLEPEAPAACAEAVESVRAADHVVLGPGSWFTSVIPHLLVPDLARAVVETDATRILVLNLVPDVETRGFTAARHLEALAEHAPSLRLDVVLADASFGEDDPHLARYAHSLGAEIRLADLSMRDGTARHDPLRLAAAYTDLLGL